jgi:phosphatidylglycerol:prolipoprotein diacylglycerol transferase
LGVAFAYGRWRGISTNLLLAAALVCVAFGALAGRAQYVWSNWDYFVENTDGIADLALGGMGWRGALIVGILALFVLALVTRQSFWQLADAAALGVALALSIGWYTAHVTHLFFGIAIDDAHSARSFVEPFAQTVRAFGFHFVQDLPDAYNVIALRIPVQRMASIFYLLLFFVLLGIVLREKSRAHDGSAFVAFLALASAASFLFGFWRGDATMLWNGLRFDQWVDLFLFAFALAFAARRKWVTRSRARPVQNTGKVIQHA